MASGKGADSTKSTNFGLLWGSLHFGCPRAGNPKNPQGPWKWLPEKERTLQNRQNLGFSGVPSFSAVPEAGNPGNPPGPEMASGKGADSTKPTTFTLLWGSPPFRRSQKPEIQKSTGAMEMASGKGADSTKSTTFGLLWGSLHFGCPRAGNQEIHRGLGNGFRKRSGLYKIDNFWAFVGFPPFRLS